MKKLLFVLALFVFSLNSFTQSSLDSLRLVLPIGHTSSLNSAEFSPDGKYALTVSYEATARINEVSSGKELQDAMPYSHLQKKSKNERAEHR